LGCEERDGPQARRVPDDMRFDEPCFDLLVTGPGGGAAGLPSAATGTRKIKSKGRGKGTSQGKNATAPQT